MRLLYLLTVVFCFGCNTATSKEPADNASDVPKFGSLKQPEAWQGDTVKVLQLLERCDKKQFAEVLPEAQEFVKKHPYDGKGWLALASAQHGLKKYDEAKQAYAKAIGFYELGGLIGLGAMYHDSGENAKAIEVYRELLKHNNVMIGAIQLTRVYLIEKKYSEAVEIAQAGFAKHPRDPVWAANLALAYHFNKDLANRDKYMNIAKEKRLPTETQQYFEKLFSGNADIPLYDK